jgi:DNA (cytosine-5)-methyltransferase 1
MNFIEQNVREFVKGKEGLYRRLSVRECARIQTFPDSFKFYYNSIVAGYKMIGNAVPVRMAKTLAQKIHKDLESLAVTDTKIADKNINVFNGQVVRERLLEIVNGIA